MAECPNCRGVCLKCQLASYQNYEWPNGHKADAKDSFITIWNELNRVIELHAELLDKHQKLIKINTLLHEKLHVK